MSVGGTAGGAPAHGDGLVRPVVSSLMFCPSFETVDLALDWFEERGVVEPVLWFGPDGLVRGSGRL